MNHETSTFIALRRECCFIDDRSINLEAAKRVGMHTIKMDSVAQLRDDLRKLKA